MTSPSWSYPEPVRRSLQRRLRRRSICAVPRVVSILEELEKHLTFVFRGDQRVVTWAYPVTVDETPHHASFSTGEEAYSP